MAVSLRALDLLIRDLLDQNTWVAFHIDRSTDPTDSSGEVSGGGYARVMIAPAGWTFTTGNERGAASNTNSVNFGTTTGSWGNLTHWSLWLSAAGTGADDFLGSARLSASQTVDTGDQVSIASGGVVFDIAQG